MKSRLFINSQFYWLVFISGTTIIGCKNRECISLDYEEVILHSDLPNNLKDNNGSSIIFNKEDTVHLSFRNSRSETKNHTYLRKIQISPVDSAIKRLGKISIDNLHSEKAKGLPQIFIVKENSAHKKIVIMEVHQAFPISDHKAGFPANDTIP